MAGVDEAFPGSCVVVLTLAGLVVLLMLPSSWVGSACRTLFFVFPAICFKVWALASPLLKGLLPGIKVGSLDDPHSVLWLRHCWVPIETVV